MAKKQRRFLRVNDWLQSQKRAPAGTGIQRPTAEIQVQPYQANRSIKLPLKPLLARSDSAVPPLWSAEDELNKVAVDKLAAVLVDDPVELLALLVEEAALEELEEVDGVEELAVFGAGAVG